MNLVDDATGVAQCLFAEEETTWAAADLLDYAAGKTVSAMARPVSSRTPRGPSVDEFPAVVFHFVSTKFFRLFRCKAEEFCGLIHYCRKELQWRA